MSMMRRSSLSTLASPTIQETSSKAVPFVASMSLGRLSSAMYQIWSNQPCICRHSPWDNVASVNAVAVPWAVLSLLPYVSWSSPSVNRFGTTPSTNFFPIITCSLNMSATSTIASFSVTNAWPHLIHMKFYWMMASMENLLSLKPSQTKNSLALWSKQSRLNWFTRDQHRCHKFSHHSQLHLLRSYSAVSGRDVTSSSRELFHPYVSNKACHN